MNDVFNKYIIEDNEIELDLAQGNYSSFKTLGLLFHKFETQDNDLFSIVFEQIEQNLNDLQFQEKIISLIKEQHHKKIKALEGKYNSIEFKDALMEMQITQLKDYIRDINFNVFIQQTSACFKKIVMPMTCIQNDIKTYENRYLHYSISKILYDDYKLNFRPEFSEPAESRLLNIYKSNSIDICAIDEQHSKYRLIAINNYVDLITEPAPQIYDKRISTYVLITSVKKTLIEHISNLIQCKSVKKFAVRPNYNLTGTSSFTSQLLMEEVEIGRVFSLQNLDKFSVSKLYSKCYQEKLWIVIDGENLTFEEIVEDYKIHEDAIVTQVVHLEYYLDNADSKYYIKHIDHEYIFYTMEEFIKRQDDHKQKGQAYSRIKTFKIDESKIPLTSSNCQMFVYMVLKSYFSNGELIDEYFSEIIKTNN